MAFATVQSWSETPASNTEIDGVNIDEGCNPSGINNAIRELMAQVAAWTGDDTIASATTTDLSTVNGQFVSVTGTTTITGFGTVKAGWVKFLHFAGALTLTHNATSMILPGGNNITTVAGDTAAFVSLGSGNWRCLVPPGYISLSAANTWTANQTITSTDAGASGPSLRLYHNSASPAVNDAVGTLPYIGKDSAGNDTTYGRVGVVIDDPTNGSEDGSIWFEGTTAGVFGARLILQPTTAQFFTPVLVPDGTVSAPAIAFSDDTDTGLYSPSNGIVAVTLNGVEHSRFSGTSLLVGATSGWANDTGTEDGFNLTTAGQIIASNTSNTTGSWRRQGTDGRMFNFYKLTTLVGGIDVDGSSTTYVTSSDGRLKVKRNGVEQEIDLDAVWAAFEPLFYNMLDGSTLEELPERLVGMVAQDLYPHLPQAVSVGHGEPGEPDFQPWGIDYSQLVPIIVSRQKQFERRTNERFAILGL